LPSVTSHRFSSLGCLEALTIFKLSILLGVVGVRVLKPMKFVFRVCEPMRGQNLGLSAIQDLIGAAFAASFYSGSSCTYGTQAW